MRITLELDKNQAAIFQDTLTTALQSLVAEETMCKEALEHRKDDDELNSKGFNNITKHLASIQPARVLLAEVLHTIMKSTESKIITDIPGKFRKIYQ